MAYYSGSANDMDALRTALTDACVLEGWTWDAANQVLYKGVVFVQLTVVGGFLRLLGRTSLTTGDAPTLCKLGPFTASAGNLLPAFSWPVAYELFLFENEVYCYINYAVDCYQWCAFGKSTVVDGPWVAATSSTTTTNQSEGISITAIGGSSGQIFICPGLLHTESVGSSSNYSIYMPGVGWTDQVTSFGVIGVRGITPLLGLLPSAWNSEAVLLPIRGWRVLTGPKTCLIADLEHCRITRNDNLEPGQIITLGGDRWKVLPCFRKNAADRNASSTPRNHSGTFAHAIRYEGP